MAIFIIIVIARIFLEWSAFDDNKGVEFRKKIKTYTKVWLENQKDNTTKNS
jgi:hypothetical protein